MSHAPLFLLHPEVAGGLGPRTVVANRAELEAGRAQLPEVVQLEYVFDGWLGDELLESFPCFIVTCGLAADIERAHLTGAAFEDVLVSTSDLFRQLHGGLSLPGFRRLVPRGRVRLTGTQAVALWSGDDICTTERAELVVSSRALAILRHRELQHCDIRPCHMGDQAHR